MADHTWIKEFPGAITVCDAHGIILALNDCSAQGHAADGGYALVGRSLLDCHPADARRKVEQLLASRSSNIYTIEKNGVKKLVYQSPWYENGEYAGLVELSLVLPAEMAHFVRG